MALAAVRRSNATVLLLLILRLLLTPLYVGVFVFVPSLVVKYLMSFSILKKTISLGKRGLVGFFLVLRECYAVCLFLLVP